MKREHLPALTGIRFFAAAWVVLFHFRDIFAELCHPLGSIIPLAVFGYVAVPFFFILSGFILSFNYFSGYSLKNHGKFVFLRFARLWPVHAVAITILLAYVVLIQLGRHHISVGNYPYNQLPGQLLMVHCWAGQTLTWNYPSWSISAEWFAYLLVFPVCYALFSRITNRPVLIAIIIGCVVAGSLAASEECPSRALVQVTMLFACGSALYQLRNTITVPPRFPFVGAGVIGAAAALVANSYGMKSCLSGLLLYASFATMILGLSWQTGLLARFLSQRWIVYGGAISYSLYMTHAVIQQAYYAIGGAMSKVVPKPLCLAILVFSLLGAACASYHIVEEPMNKRLRSQFEMLSGRR